MQKEGTRPASHRRAGLLHAIYTIPAALRATAERGLWGWRTASLGPLVAILIVFTLVPILYLAAMSVHDIVWRGGVVNWTFVGLSNYAGLIDTPYFAATFRNTTIFVASAVTVEMILGFALALLVSRLSKTRALFIALYLLPILVPPIVIGAMWKLLYNFDFGPINGMFLALGLPPLNWLGDKNLALLSVIIVDIWHWTPFTFLLLLAGIEGVPQDIVEAARIDGASLAQEVRHIIIPVALPVILITLVTRTLLAFKVFDEIFLLTGGGPGTATEVLSFTVFRIFFSEDRQGDGAAMAVLVIAFVMLIGLVGLMGVRRRTEAPR